jgi:hypothetical protein
MNLYHHPMCTSTMIQDSSIAVTEGVVNEDAINIVCL